MFLDFLCSFSRFHHDVAEVLYIRITVPSSIFMASFDHRELPVCSHASAVQDTGFFHKLCCYIRRAFVKQKRRKKESLLKMLMIRSVCRHAQPPFPRCSVSSSSTTTLSSSLYVTASYRRSFAAVRELPWCSPKDSPNRRQPERFSVATSEMERTNNNKNNDVDKEKVC